MKQRVLWTDDEVEILRQSYPDKDNHELSKVFGVTPGLITSLSTLVVAVEHNPSGAADLVTLATLLLLAVALTRHTK